MNCSDAGGLRRGPGLHDATVSTRSQDTTDPGESEAAGTECLKRGEPKNRIACIPGQTKPTFNP